MMHCGASAKRLKVYCLRVRDCCECFVYKYTHAFIVQWTRNFNTARGEAECSIENEREISILHEAKPSAVLKISGSLYDQQVRIFVDKTRTLQSLTHLIYNLSSLNKIKENNCSLRQHLLTSVKKYKV
jgi:hypothetical protein